MQYGSVIGNFNNYMAQPKTSKNQTIDPNQVDNFSPPN